MKKLVKFTAIVLVMALLGGCASSVTDLMGGVQGGAQVPSIDLMTEAEAVTDFGVRLFRQCHREGENTLISPLSVLCALSMTANGARGDTLDQMESVLRLNVDTLNSWLHSCMASLPEGEKYKLSLANSVWIKDMAGFSVEEDFLQRNADYHDAGIFRAAFDDSTKDAINSWVKENTDGMIDSILQEIPADAVMYLINALAFEAQWQNIYKESQIREGQFHLADAEGTTREVELMYSQEDRYLQDDQATGFIKYYAGREYAFVALLPNEDVTVGEYVQSLTGEHLHELLSQAEDVTVHAAIPKFQLKYGVEMSEMLKALGMTDAFNSEKADLSGIGQCTAGNLYINRVLHKTYICVDAQGTKAGAVTAVEVATESAMLEPEEYKTVTLDRPFVYLLIDCRTNMPFFIGTLMDVEG